MLKRWSGGVKADAAELCRPAAGRRDLNPEICHGRGRLLVIVVVGLVAGCSPVSWCAEAAWASSATCWSAQLKGHALHVAGGALIGNWLLPRLHVDLGSGLLAATVDATIGAVILLVVLRLVFGMGRGRRGRRF